MENRSPLDLTKAEWADWMEANGESAFRAEQVFAWIHGWRRINSFDKMTNLSKSLRKKLTEAFPMPFWPVAQTVQKADSTAKFLWRYEDGALVESVLLEYEFGYSLCVSSQVGCRMGCRFCASTLNGLERSLSAGEMLGEVYAAENKLGIKISHIVIMGSGEPFDNYDEVIRFMTLLHSNSGHCTSYRNMTVSTCGLVPGIKAFADWGAPVTLAISLHAPSQEKRLELMKIARSYPVSELMEAARYYTRKTNRRITFEYALMDGINCSAQDARELSDMLGRSLPKNLIHVNLIPVNPVEECGFSRPSDKTVKAFMAVLEAAGISVTLRRSLGGSVDGACGQLRAKTIKSR